MRRQALLLLLLIAQTWNWTLNQTDVTNITSTASSVFFSMFFIVIPFLLAIILWKSFIKIVKL